MINSYCPIVTLIGSNDDVDEIKKVSNELTLQGKIVFVPSIFNNPNFFTDPSKITKEEREAYDIIDKQKIRISHSVLIIDARGYSDPDVMDKIDFCDTHHIPTRYMPPRNIKIGCKFWKGVNNNE